MNSSIQGLFKLRSACVDLLLFSPPGNKGTDDPVILGTKCFLRVPQQLGEVCLPKLFGQEVDRRLAVLILASGKTGAFPEQCILPRRCRVDGGIYFFKLAFGGFLLGIQRADPVRVTSLLPQVHEPLVFGIRLRSEPVGMFAQPFRDFP